jgi:hypothetical protein
VGIGSAIEGMTRYGGTEPEFVPKLLDADFGPRFSENGQRSHPVLGNVAIRFRIVSTYRTRKAKTDSSHDGRPV